ncbi:hypothetical protein [Rhodovulum sp. P5]|uniref:hypothetical protein n=1 Tax=Rhodovulum sp. P5 TaxID=1564506 RepID=UPI0012EB98B3|nr:hypothetical protein [Rhodovulum sp. P5]
MILLPAHLARHVGAVVMTALLAFAPSKVRAGETITGHDPATKDEKLEKFAAWHKTNNR